MEPEAIAGALLSALRSAGMVFSGREVLDAGCGTGVYARLIARMGASRVLGVDVELGNIQKAGDVAGQGNLFFREGSIEDPMEPESVDVVFCKGAAYYVQDLDGLLRTFSVTLRHGGDLYITFTENTRSARFQNAFKRLATRVPDWFRPVFRDALACLYMAGQLCKGADAMPWSIVRGKMNTIFYPAVRILSPEEFRQRVAAAGFSTVAFFKRGGPETSSTDFALWARKI